MNVIMKKYFTNAFSVTFFVFVLFGCQTQDIPDEALYTISLDTNDSVNFCDLVSDYEYIVLEQDSACLMSEVNQIIVAENNFYVLANGVFCFKHDGKLLFKIVSRGHASNEFIDCTSMSVYDGTIYLYDKVKKQVMLYDCFNGKYIGCVNVPEGIRNVYKVSENYLLENTGFETEFLPQKVRFVDTDSTIKTIQNRYFEQDLFIMGILGQISVTNESVIFTDYFNNNAYKYSNNTFSKLLSIENEDKLTMNQIDEIVESGRLPRNETCLYGLRNLYENENHLVGEFCYDSKLNYFILDKNTRKSISYQNVSSELFQLKPVDVCASCNDSFYRYIPGASLALVKDIVGFGDKLDTTDPNFSKQNLLEDCAHKEKDLIIRFKYKQIK